MQTVLLLITLVGTISGWLLFFVTRGQLNAANKQLALNISMAAPKIGLTLKIDKRQESPPGFPPFYYLIATIYNEGQFPAKKLQGKCTLFSPINEVLKFDVPIDRDFLGSTPYQLEPRKIEGTTVDASFRGRQKISINIDIEFTYFGIPDDQQQRYGAKYQYDPASSQFLRSD